MAAQQPNKGTQSNSQQNNSPQSSTEGLAAAQADAAQADAALLQSEIDARFAEEQRKALVEKAVQQRMQQWRVEQGLTGGVASPEVSLDNPQGIKSGEQPYYMVDGYPRLPNGELIPPEVFTRHADQSRGVLAARGGLGFVTQLAADLADRAHGVDALFFFGGTIIDDLRVDLTGHGGQVLATRHIGGEHQRAEHTQPEGTDTAFTHAHRIVEPWPSEVAAVSRSVLRSFMVDSLSIRPASAVDRAKSRCREEPIETVCNKDRARLVIQVQMMATGQGRHGKR